MQKKRIQSNFYERNKNERITREKHKKQSKKYFKKTKAKNRKGKAEEEDEPVDKRNPRREEKPEAHLVSGDIRAPEDIENGIRPAGDLESDLCWEKKVIFVIYLIRGIFFRFCG